MEINPEHISPCGLYCGVCGIYRATQENNLRFLKITLRMYQSIIPNSGHFSVEDLLCDGCHSERRSFTCNSCAIRDCSEKKQNNGCHECSSFPCEYINNFPIPTGKKVILRSIPYIQEHGISKWIESEEARYFCPTCNNLLFRGVKRCNKCKETVDLD